MDNNEKLHIIAYISTAQTETSIELNIIDIVETAQQMNPKFGITGVLFFNQGLFMQVIEGEKAHLDQLMANIKQDPRHTDLRVLLDEPTNGRGFPAWNMDCFNLSSDEHLNQDKLVQLSREFQENLVPRADVFVKFYKAILERSNKGG